VIHVTPVRRHCARSGIDSRAETVAQFTAMADEYHVVFGELLQQALDALKRERARRG
jgi:hypothetical protein